MNMRIDRQYKSYSSTVTVMLDISVAVCDIFAVELILTLTLTFRIGLGQM